MNHHCCTHETRSAHHSSEFKQDLLNRLHRIEGQVRGLQNMIEGDTYCNDVLIQIAAVRSALASVANKLFDAHMKTCITEQIQSGRSEVVDELLQTMKRMMK